MFRRKLLPVSRAAGFVLCLLSIGVGALPAIYTERELGNWLIPIYLYASAAGVLGIAIYAKTVGRSMVWCVLGFLTSYGTTLALLWLTPEIDFPHKTAVLMLLFSMALGYDWAFFRGQVHRLTTQDLSVLAMIGLIVGLLDPARGTVWAATVFLPSFMDSVVWSVEASSSDFTINWVIDMFFPILHAMFGGRLGGLVRWVISRSRGEQDERTVSLQYLPIVALNVVLLTTLDPYVSLALGGNPRVRQSWESLFSIFLLSAFTGWMVGLRFIRLRQDLLHGNDAPVLDPSCRLELLFWAALLLASSARRALFEGCFFISPWAASSCFYKADTPCLVLGGMACGALVALHHRATYWNQESWRPLMVRLAPGKRWQQWIALPALAVAALNMGMCSFEAANLIRSEGKHPTKVYLVPIGQGLEVSLPDLANHYERSLGLSIEVLPPTPLKRYALTYQREQLIGEELINIMKENHRGPARDQNVVMIGITEDDIYSCNYSAYSLLQCALATPYALGVTDGGRFAVISAHRLIVPKPKDPDLSHSRLRKLVTAYLLNSMFKSPMTSFPSVNPSAAFAADELDKIDEALGMETIRRALADRSRGNN
jgi:uncharacterized membrane protein